MQIKNLASWNAQIPNLFGSSVIISRILGKSTGKSEKRIDECGIEQPGCGVVSICCPSQAVLRLVRRVRILGVEGNTIVGGIAVEVAIVMVKVGPI